MALPAWREVAVPHEDIRRGRFDESAFAADLADVQAGRGPLEYRDPPDLLPQDLPHRGDGQAPRGHGAAAFRGEGGRARGPDPDPLRRGEDPQPRGPLPPLPLERGGEGDGALRPGPRGGGRGGDPGGPGGRLRRHRRRPPEGPHPLGGTRLPARPLRPFRRA